MKIIKQLEGGGSSAGTFLIQDASSQKVVMKSANWSGIGSNGIPWLKAQFERLKELKTSLPPLAAARIPKVYEYSENKNSAYYTLQYFEDGIPLSTYHLQQPKSSADAFLNDLNDLLTFMSEQFYSQGREEVPDEYLDRVYLHRLQYRLNLLQAIKGEVYEKLIKGRRFKIRQNKYCKLEEMFARMWSPQKLLINNKEYLNAPILLNRLETDSSFLERLRPSFLPKFSHGDALLRNFMKVKDGNIMIFDVRGVDLPENSPARIDIAFELGKMLHGILLEIIRNNLFSLIIKEEGGSLAFNLDYDFRKKEVLNFLEVREKMPKLFQDNYKLNCVLKEEPNWLQKALFAEATHFLTDAINRLENDASGRHAIAYYLIGTMLLNDYIYKYEIS